MYAITLDEPVPFALTRRAAWVLSGLAPPDEPCQDPGDSPDEPPLEDGEDDEDDQQSAYR